MNFLEIHNNLRGWMNHAYTRLVKNSFGAMGAGCQIALPFKSCSAKNIFLGNNVKIYAGAWIDCFSEYYDKKWQPKLEIGDGTYIGHQSHIMVVGKMKIGKNVLIADKVYISDNLHSFEDVTCPILPQPLKHARVTIEDEVWLGENACVLPGVTIGRHSIIGSNSVVTKSIPPYSVAAGSPAKVIRQYNQDTGQWERIK